MQLPAARARRRRIRSVRPELAAQALATPPGKNGRIAFMRAATPKIRTARSSRATRTAKLEARDHAARRWRGHPTRLVGRRLPHRLRARVPRQAVRGVTVRPDGSEPALVDPGCPAGIPPTEICEESRPVWSPDGALHRLRVGLREGASVLGEDTIEVAAIGVIDADGGNVRQVTQLVRPTHSEDGEPVWSPDGKQIAFVRLNVTAKPRDRKAIFVVNADGSGLKRLSPWSLNGKRPTRTGRRTAGRSCSGRSRSGIDFQRRSLHGAPRWHGAAAADALRRGASACSRPRSRPTGARSSSADPARAACRTSSRCGGTERRSSR